MANLNLVVLKEMLAVCRLPASDSIPAWASAGPMTSVTRTADELSIVCLEENVPAGVKCERGWRCLKVQGPLDFGLTGILASLASPLANARISIFAVSTFDTDYLLVRSENLDLALQVLIHAGHSVSR